MKYGNITQFGKSYIHSSADKTDVAVQYCLGCPRPHRTAAAQYGLCSTNF